MASQDLDKRFNKLTNYLDAAIKFIESGGTESWYAPLGMRGVYGAIKLLFENLEIAWEEFVPNHEPLQAPVVTAVALYHPTKFAMGSVTEEDVVAMLRFISLTYLPEVKLVLEEHKSKDLQLASDLDSHIIDFVRIALPAAVFGNVGEYYYSYNSVSLTSTDVSSDCDSVRAKKRGIRLKHDEDKDELKGILGAKKEGDEAEPEGRDVDLKRALSPSSSRS